MRIKTADESAEAKPAQRIPVGETGARKRSRFDSIPLKPWLAYFFATGTTIATLGLRLALDGTLGGQPTLVIFTVPIMLSAYLGGMGAGLLATALSFFLATYYLLPPLHNLAITSQAQRWDEMLVLLAGLVISVSNEALHRARQRAVVATNQYQTADEALQKTNILQKAIFNSTNIARIVTDANGIIQSFNVGAEQMLGYKAEEVLYKITPADLADPKELSELTQSLCVDLGTTIANGFEALTINASRGTEDFFDLTYIHKDGGRLPLVMFVTALRDANDAIIGYLMNGSDNTARRQIEEEKKRSEEARRLSEERFRALVTASSDVVYRMNPDWTEMRQLDGRNFIVDTQEPSRAWLQEYIHPDDQPRVKDAINEAIRTKSTFELEHRVKRVDGSLGWTFSRAIPLSDANGEIVEWFGAASDVTERKVFERTLQEKNIELELASLMKSEFLATMSHELRTPLNSILGFSELLRDGMLGEMTDKQRAFTSDIYSSGTHLLSLINDILDLSKVEAGKMALDLEPVLVSSLLTNSLSIVREKAASNRIRIDMEVAPDLGSLQLDARKVKQMVYNLLSNAVKFSPDGSLVTLSASRVPRADVGRILGTRGTRNFPLTHSNDSEFLEISVTDNGIGISATGLESLFKPFSQIDSSLARKFEGTGLGLVMVKLLAELHGGSVAVESTPGEGSCFTIWLPLRVPEDQSLIEFHTPAVQAEALPGVPVALVVEDDLKSAELIRVQLEAEGFIVLHAASAEVALALAIQQPIALITLDILLPNMEGWEFLSRIKRIPELSRTPVVIISIVADSTKGISLGAAAVMQKPVSRQELYESLLDLGLLPLSAGQTLKVLVVDDDPKAVEIVALGILGQSSTVLRAYGGREAIEMARRELPDVIVLDLMMPDVSGFDVVEALSEQPNTANIPIVVVTAKQITADDHLKLSRYVTMIMEKSCFTPNRLAAEIRRSMLGKGMAV